MTTEAVSWKVACLCIEGSLNVCGFEADKPENAVLEGHMPLKIRLPKSPKLQLPPVPSKRPCGGRLKR